MNRILKADAIFTGTKLISGNHLLVVSQEGRVIEIIEEHLHFGPVEQFRGMLCPGFVNAHCHLELSHLKGMIEQHTGLPQFLFKLQQVRKKPEKEKKAAMQEAAKEMWDAGIVAVGDICNSTDTVALKKNHPIRFHNFLEMFGLITTDVEWKINQAREMEDVFRAAVPTQGFSFTPHAPYSISAALYAFLNEATAGKIISMHNQETPAEDELSEKGTGPFLDFYKKMGIAEKYITSTNTRSLKNWLPKFNKQQRIIAVHNTHTLMGDIDFVKNEGKHIESFSICLCPNANMYIENRLPDIPMLMQSGFPILLGTDSYASNTQLSIWTEIQTIRSHFPEIPLQTILQWATLNGATALGFADTLGSFEKGKTPGIVLIEEDSVRRV